MRGLAARQETTDGSRPSASTLDAAIARRHPLGAFAALRGAGDAFEGTRQAPDARAAAEATRACFSIHGATAAEAKAIEATLTGMWTASPALAARVRHMKRVRVDVVPEGGRLSDVGFPPVMNERAAGVFWDKPEWPEAHVGLRAEHLAKEPILVVHEAAHALHHLAFTAEERALVDAVLMPVWRSRGDVDEVFAIYSEREFLERFGVDARRAPGVYGEARRQWRDDHLFTRFVRKLYFPQKPLAGDDAPRARDWKRFAG